MAELIVSMEECDAAYIEFIELLCQGKPIRNCINGALVAASHVRNGRATIEQIRVAAKRTNRTIDAITDRLCRAEPNDERIG